VARVVVNLVELNRRRHVELESITAALAEALHVAGARATEGIEPAEVLEPVRELVRALRGLIAQPLPEAFMAGTGELEVELVAPVHELEQLAGELEGIADRFYPAGAASEEREALDELAARVRARARA